MVSSGCNIDSISTSSQAFCPVARHLSLKSLRKFFKHSIAWFNVPQLVHSDSAFRIKHKYNESDIRTRTTNTCPSVHGLNPSPVDSSFFSSTHPGVSSTACSLQETLKSQIYLLHILIQDMAMQNTAQAAKRTSLGNVVSDQGLSKEHPLLFKSGQWCFPQSTYTRSACCSMTSKGVCNFLGLKRCKVAITARKRQVKLKTKAQRRTAARSSSGQS